MIITVVACLLALGAGKYGFLLTITLFIWLFNKLGSSRYLSLDNYTDPGHWHLARKCDRSVYITTIISGYMYINQIDYRCT